MTNRASQMIKKIGKRVKFFTGAEHVTGIVHSVGDANDGSGRIGYWVRAGKDMWWSQQIRSA
jgi:hypothetical protein